MPEGETPATLTVCAYDDLVDHGALHRSLTQSEVIRAILLEYSSCCGSATVRCAPLIRDVQGGTPGTQRCAGLIGGGPHVLGLWLSELWHDTVA